MVSSRILETEENHSDSTKGDHQSGEDMGITLQPFQSEESDPEITDRHGGQHRQDRDERKKNRRGIKTKPTNRRGGGQDRKERLARSEDEDNE